MTNYTINTSSATYQTRTPANVSSPVKIDNFVEADNAGVAIVDSNHESSFVQRVFQSLQSLGINAFDSDANGKYAVNDRLSPNESEALQTFLQGLYKELTLGNAAHIVSDNNVAEFTENSDSALTEISAGKNFKYSVDLSEADLGDYLPSVKANIQTALENIAQYINSKIVFNLKVLTQHIDSNTLAEANSSLITTKSNQQDASLDTSFVSDSIHGVELNPDIPDARLYINLAKIDEMSFSGLPVADKFDLTSILTHEILHGLAFTGSLDSNNSLKTGYDELVSTQNAIPVFVGRHAKTVNAGNPIPLTSVSTGEGSAYYHVAIPNDLMAESIKKGEVKTISALDIAMLEDIGIAVTGVLPNSSKLQDAYNNPTTNLRNLINSVKQHGVLQTNFENLIQSLGGSSTANLQDFLTQLAANTENNNSLQNGVGALLSTSA